MERWTTVKTWKEFEFQWASNTTEPGAVGLLYAGAKLKESGQRTPDECGHEDEVWCFASKVSFFLETAAGAGSQLIETTARRLLVNELLYEALCLSWTGLIGPCHAKLVDFLGVVHQDLRKPPFPRKVEEFLYQSFTRWKAKERERKAPYRHRREVDLGRVSSFGEYYDRTEPLVRACVAWGVLPQVLVKQWFTPELLQEIRVVAEPLLLASLGEKEDLRIKRLRGSLTWAMNEESPRDLHREEGQTELWKKNGITLHFLRSVE